MTFFQRPQQTLLRKAIFQVHLWTGVAMALYVVVVGITGSALVFRQEMQAVTFPEYFDIDRQEESDASAGVIIQNLQERYPGAKLAGLDYPTYRRGTYLSYLTRGNQLLTVFSHPVTAEVMGEMPRSSWITLLQELHFNLSGGRTGRQVNGLAAFLLVSLFGTGLFVWWPGIERWQRSLRVDFRHGWKRVNWELHSAVGFCMFTLLMVWAVTGIEFAFPQGFRRTVNAISPITVVRPPQSKPAAPGSKPVEAAALVDKAKALVPGAKMGRIVMPSNAKGSALVLMAYKTHGDFDTSDEVNLYFDQYSGALLLRRQTGPERASMGDVFMKWVGPIHVGSFGGSGAGGTVVKWLWAVLALSFPLLAISGVVMWWNRVISVRWKRN